MDVEAESGLPHVKLQEEAATMSTATTTATTPLDIPSNISSTSSSSTDRCVICLDTVAEPCVAQPCGHRHFDFLCLISWLLQCHPSCPLCKATVVSVQYGDDLAKTFPVPKREEDGPGEAVASTESASTPASAPVPLRPQQQRRHRRDLPSFTSPSESPAAALEHRRRVYRLGLYARHVGANRHSRYYRELTPQLFAQDPDLVSRARAFLRRELQVFWGGEDRIANSDVGVGSRRANNVEFLLEYIVAILQSIDLQDSAGQAEELLQGFFRGRRDHTRQFLHELRSFLRSPYLTLANWDRHVQYGPPGTLYRGEEDEDNEQETRRVEEKRQDTRRVARGDYWQPSRSRHRGRAGSSSRLICRNPAAATIPAERQFLQLRT